MHLAREFSRYQFNFARDVQENMMNNLNFFLALKLLQKVRFMFSHSLLNSLSEPKAPVRVQGAGKLFDPMIPNMA